MRSRAIGIFRAPCRCCLFLGTESHLAKCSPAGRKAEAGLNLAFLSETLNRSPLPPYPSWASTFLIFKMEIHTYTDSSQ